MATRFGHLCFLVRDLAASQDFYIRQFGMQLEKEVPGLDGKPSVFLTLNGVTFLELWQQDDPGAMHGHLALWVDDIEAIARQLAQAGFPVSPRDLRPSGNTIAFVNDPDGNTIELLCAPSRP